MAVNDDLREGKKLLEELNILRRKLNQTPLRLTDDETTRQLRSLPEDIERAKKALSDMEGSATNLYDRLRGVTSELKGQETATTGIRSAFRSLTKDVEKLKFDEQEISKLSAKELQSLQKRVKENKDRIDSSAEEILNSSNLAKKLNSIVESRRAQKKEEDKIQESVGMHLKRSKILTEEQKSILAYYFDQNNIIEEINGKIKERVAFEEKAAKATRKFTALADLSSAIPGLRKLAGPFKEAEQAARKAFEATEDGSKANAAGIKALGKAFSSPLLQLGLLASLFKGVLDIAFKLDSQITEIGKSQGKSYKQAAAFREELQDAADASYNYLQTTKSLFEAQAELGESAGVSAGFKIQELQDQVRLTKQVGLQAADAAKLSTLARVNGITTTDTLKGIIKQTTALKLQSGVTFDNRKILKEVANISGQLAANYKNSPSLIAAAVVQTRKLGMSLEQAAQASRGLLDFESSISNELEAELLTGKELNLEKARYLALQGDSAGAAAELAKNFGSLEEFQNMNVLAQEAMAKAVGMTADELSNTLLQQENLSKLGDETQKQLEVQVKKLKDKGDLVGANALSAQTANEEEALAALDRISNQEKFNAAIEKAKDLFTGMIDNMPTLLGILGTIAGVMAGIALSAVITSGGTALIGAGIAIASAGLIGGAIGTGLGIAASSSTSGTGEGKAGEATKINDGIIDPDGGLIVSGPKGSIRLDKKDSIVAGTQLDKSDSSNNSSILEKLDRLIAAVERGGTVYMDGNKVGESLLLATHKLS